VKSTLAIIGGGIGGVVIALIAIHIGDRAVGIVGVCATATMTYALIYALRRDRS
jgi:hypothetical protein